MAERFDPARLARRDLRRLVGEMWTDERCDQYAAQVLDTAIATDTKSLDRAVLTAYLRHFPRDHPAFDRLAPASALVAERRDWPWRQRGRDWALWDAEAGPERVATALLNRDDAVATLREAGLDSDLAQGEFVADALEAACEQAATATNERAVALGTRLIGLFEQLAIGGSDAMLAWALLAPWVSRRPPKAYEQTLTRLLVTKIGDPRIAQARWAALEETLRQHHGQTPSRSLAAMLRFWLTEATVRGFFSIVRATTDRQDQWDAREAFWLGYLDAGAINEAWFAFGRLAEQQAGRMAKEQDIRYARIVGGGADPSHSALIFSIGDARMAEWSHNGQWRVWPLRAGTSSVRSGRPAAPELYQSQYDGQRLRTTIGPAGFEHHSHMSGWQAKFAGVIYRMTGVLHSRWGSGR